MKAITLLAAAFMASVPFQSQGATGMNGQTLRVTLSAPTEYSLISTWDVVVGSTIELPSISPVTLGPMSIDFTNTQIIITALTNWAASSASGNPFNGYNGLYFSDVNNTIDSFAFAQMNPSTTPAWFEEWDNMSSNENNIWTNFLKIPYVNAGQSMVAGDRIVLDALAAPVPEPSLFSLFLAGAAVLGAVRKKRTPA